MIFEPIRRNFSMDSVYVTVLRLAAEDDLN